MDGGPAGKGRGAITGLPCRGRVMTGSRRGIGTTVFAPCITGGACGGVGAIMCTPCCGTVFITGAPCGGDGAVRCCRAISGAPCGGGSTVKDPCSVGRTPGAPYIPADAAALASWTGLAANTGELGLTTAAWWTGSAVSTGELGAATESWWMGCAADMDELRAAISGGWWRREQDVSDLFAGVG